VKEIDTRDKYSSKKINEKYAEDKNLIFSISIVDNNSSSNLTNTKSQVSPPGGSVAGLAANFNNSSSLYQQVCSNSVNAKSHPTTTTTTTSLSSQPQQHPVVLLHNHHRHHTLANRKPSLKFESNILNRVQNINNLIQTTTTTSTTTASSSKSSSRASLNLQQQTNVSRTPSLTGAMHTPNASIANQGSVNSGLHQVSLDSGIYLPSD
jgi:hypothetical protein